MKATLCISLSLIILLHYLMNNYAFFFLQPVQCFLYFCSAIRSLFNRFLVFTAISLSDSV